ncbi:hypothetical protein KC352_g10249 [Hortaea werneckii]|nr:hypothetical protein KC352_g10249 [Hortaea werneckii]
MASVVSISGSGIPPVQGQGCFRLQDSHTTAARGEQPPAKVGHGVAAQHIGWGGSSAVAAEDLIIGGGGGGGGGGEGQLLVIAQGQDTTGAHGIRLSEPGEGE